MGCKPYCNELQPLTSFDSQGREILGCYQCIHCGRRFGGVKNSKKSEDT